MTAELPWTNDGTPDPAAAPAPGGELPPSPPTPAPPPRPPIRGDLHLSPDNRFLRGTGTDQVGTPNHGVAFGPGKPDMVVLHYTASGTAQSAIAHFLNPASMASAHLVIDRDGTITQMVPFDLVAWHAGSSFWQGVQWVNPRAIGLELVNWGWLHQGPDNGGAYLTHPAEKQARYWQHYPYDQVQAAAAVCRVLRRAFRISWVVGHEDVSPGRKTDPGPAFPWDNFRLWMTT